jgi:hypothetical protein
MPLLGLMENLKLESAFIRNILSLITGTIIAQAIPVAISLILTRLLSEKMAKEVMTLTMNLFLTDKEISYIGNTIKNLIQ